MIIALLDIEYIFRTENIQEDVCTHLYIAAFNTLAKIWNKSRCQMTHECIMKMWYICPMEYYIVI